MKCQDLQHELPLYSDNMLSENEIEQLDRHLTACPLCRQRLSEIQENKLALRSLSRPVISPIKLNKIRAKVAEQTGSRIFAPSFRLIETKRNWREVWLMPSLTGVAASILMCFVLLSTLLIPPQTFEIVAENQRLADEARAAYLASASLGYDSGSFDISPLQYANQRFMVADESPSVNPHGALVALTRSLMRGEMNDEEVVVVADVFGNGLARIAEVVEPSHDRQAVIKLQQTLQTDPDFAPFVPASMDKRSQNVRVVLKFHSVNVEADSTTPAL